MASLLVAAASHTPPAIAPAVMPALARCGHCGARVSRGERYCCRGCEAVHDLLTSEGLARYYDLRGPDGVPVLDPFAGADHKWLEKLALGPSISGTQQTSLDIQGLHCAACVWLIEQLFVRQPEGAGIVVNPALGRMDLTVKPGFDLAAFVSEVEQFGYRLGPALKDAPKESGDLLMRLGICIAIAMNAMIFAFAIYAGLHEGPIFRLFHAIEFALAVVSVLVGGTVFFRSAWQGIRHRIVHLDVPIALGILLAFGSSAYAFVSGRSAATYFDTLTVFIALMLLGRYLQERVLERNRRMVLEATGAERLLTRRIEDGKVRTVACRELRSGDRLLIAPGDLVPCNARLDDARALLSLEWIVGESAPQEATMGEEILAGAFNRGAQAFTAVCTMDFADSPLVALLQQTKNRAGEGSRRTPFWQKLSTVYVLAVLAIGALGFVGWALWAHDPVRAIDVTAAILIVTCPCAFGIATPLAYELVYAGLRRRGLFVRSAGFLERAKDIREIIFDKTGTLTTGRLHLTNNAALAQLGPRDRRALYNMVARSTHPKSLALAVKLESTESFESEVAVHEQAGIGLTMRGDDGTYDLRADEEALAFVRDGQTLALFSFDEQLRSDAADEVRNLERDGYGVWILSGDAQARVLHMGQRLGIPNDRALGGRSPRDKATEVATHPHALMIGDGINDSFAVDTAYCSGTPAIDRPFLPSKSDFYFTTPGLGPVTLALRAARKLRAVTTRNLTVALAYNALTIALSLAGLMSPLVCAVVMPLSSLSLVLATTASLGSGSSLWKY